ncbi:hypothetical protein J3E72DRAFT_269392 [Bipolaris maydis]|nr:hypothetical protein J3E72DRAFT_269392 [Bipolaris maydis]
MFNDPMEFKAISRTAVLQLTPKFSAEWEKEELFSILPLRVIDGLETELQYVEHSLRGSSRCYDTWQLLCTQCGRSLPGNAKKCHPCRNTELPTKYCTSETRIAEYFEALRKAELWPTLGSFAACSVSDIASRFARARKGMRHTCEAEMMTGLEKVEIVPTNSRIEKQCIQEASSELFKPRIIPITGEVLGNINALSSTVIPLGTKQKLRTLPK